MDTKNLFLNCNSSEGSLLLIIQWDEWNKQFKLLKIELHNIGELLWLMRRARDNQRKTKRSRVRSPSRAKK
jgi:hypothetical protein